MLREKPTEMIVFKSTSLKKVANPQITFNKYILRLSTNVYSLLIQIHAILERIKPLIKAELFVTMAADKKCRKM